MRYPRIVAAIESLPVQSATIDGEAVWLDEQGIGDFRKLHSRTLDWEVTFFAFDMLEIDRRDIRKEPLERRRAPISSSAITMKAMARRFSRRPASSASRASSRSVATWPMKAENPAAG
jgi:ATP-dependent DNA ligase